MPFTCTYHSADASFPRYHGSTPLPTDRLKLAYIKYTNIAKPTNDAIEINMVFSHGTGMNKSVWKYHIENLYKYAEQVGGKEKWYLKSVIAYDHTGHGDSAVMNQNKLGWVYRWEDGGKDIIKLVQHEQKVSGDFINDATHRVILVGHSLGATSALFALAFDSNMFDTAIAIEPVAYIDTKKTQDIKIGIRRFQKLASMIMDTFENEQDFETYYKMAPIYSKFNKRIFNDFLADEKWLTNNGKVKSKASQTQQMITYLSAFHSVPHLMELYKTIRSHVVHVIGSKATWNPVEAAPFIRSSIQADFLTAIDVPEGDHILNCERPDDLLQIIHKTLSDRANIAHFNKGKYPEIKCHGNRDEISQQELEKIMSMDFMNETNFSKARL